jgi:hypothetical protein
MQSEGGPITIVSGIPRSGTSMMMQILEAGGLEVLTDGVRAADEDNPRGYYEFEPVRRTAGDASWVDEARGCAVKVVHAHLSVLPVGPVYRVVFLLRDLDEVLDSQDRMLERRGEPVETADRARLRRAFERDLDRVRAYLAAVEHLPTHYVEHRDLVGDPSSAIAGVARFLGGGLDREAMRRAIDPGLYRQRGGGYVE